ncbi:hypothetical protein AV530_016037 [Patagioenas fasciata monilis]|uniref:Uncharacterized protein n=1 Tax=Patagioenas fasciata monilis TaxID=372326 RepID=A0A1V4KJV8_PATFA|nr:hypothetical protein AV530_016037 [Patagioenas fasciata monilis]
MVFYTINMKFPSFIFFRTSPYAVLEALSTLDKPRHTQHSSLLDTLQLQLPLHDLGFIQITDLNLLTWLKRTATHKDDHFPTLTDQPSSNKKDGSLTQETHFGN